MIVIAGDLHGSPESLDLITTSLRLADGKRNWIAEDTVFILTGDACDRGHDSASIYRLIMKWQDEAPDCGSEVLFLPGNHEIMNISGELYYNTREETASYAAGSGSGNLEKLRAFSEGGWLYEWLKLQPFIVKRGPFIAAHADFPSGYADFTINEINSLSKSMFSRSVSGHAGIDPLLWSREARTAGTGYENALRKFLKNNGARSWVCGHTPSVDGRIRTLAGNSYICIDTAMSLGIRNTSVLVYREPVLSVIYPGRRSSEEIIL